VNEAYAGLCQRLCGLDCGLNFFRLLALFAKNCVTLLHLQECTRRASNQNYGNHVSNEYLESQIPVMAVHNDTAMFGNADCYRAKETRAFNRANQLLNVLL
jgi:hypothetical protein